MTSDDGARQPQLRLSDVLADLHSCVDNIECDCIDPPPDDKDDDYEAHAQYCRIYLAGYIAKLRAAASDAEPITAAPGGAGEAPDWIKTKARRIAEMREYINDANRDERIAALAHDIEQFVRAAVVPSPPAPEVTPWTIDGSMPLPACVNDTVRRADVVTMWNAWRCGLPADRPFRHSDGVAFLNKLNEIPSALSSPSVADSPTWQPIDTHDGSSNMPVLVADRGDVVEAYYSAEHDVWWEINSCDDGSPGSDRRVHPTHWMPLPAPPSGSPASPAASPTTKTTKA